MAFPMTGFLLILKLCSHNADRIKNIPTGQKIMVLHVLDLVGSDSLSEYLDKAMEMPYIYHKENAENLIRKIREQGK